MRQGLNNVILGSIERAAWLVGDCVSVFAIIINKQAWLCWGLLYGVAPRSRHPPPHSLSYHCRMMLDSVTHSTFLPNASFCDPLMSWTDLFSSEEYYPAFEHQTGVYVWRGPS